MSDTESRVLDTLAAINLTSLEQVTGLDPQTVVFVRFAALVAVDAAPLSYLTHLAVGQEAGINGEQVEDVLLALAPLVASARSSRLGPRSLAPSGSQCSAPKPPSRLTTTSGDDHRDRRTSAGRASGASPVWAAAATTNACAHEQSGSLGIG